MRDYRPGTYGDRIADVYDELYPPPADIDDAARLVIAYANGGRVLELGVGTGHLALALAEYGTWVCGLDASAAMLARLGAKPGADRVVRVLADMAEMPLAGPFEAVVVVNYTLANLTSAEAQQRCLNNIARCLGPSGVLIVEGYVPPAERSGNQTISVAQVDADRVVLRVARFESDSRVVNGATIILEPDGLRLCPVIARDHDIDELDRMAAVAGLDRVELWSDWNRTPFTPDDHRYVAVYRPVHHGAGGPA